MRKAPGTRTTTLAGGQQYAQPRVPQPKGPSPAPYTLPPTWNGESSFGTFQNTAQTPSPMPAPTTAYSQAPAMNVGLAPLLTNNGFKSPSLRANTPSGEVKNQAQTNVQSSITPTNVFDQGLTNAARNQGVAQALAAGNPYSAQKAVTRPGFSRGAGTDRLAAPIIAQGQANAAQAASMIPYSDQMANMNFNLRGQQTRDAESQGLAQLGNNMTNFNRSNTLNNQRSATSLLQALLGGF